MKERSVSNVIFVITQVFLLVILNPICWFILTKNLLSKFFELTYLLLLLLWYFFLYYSSRCDECEQSFRQKQLLKRHKNLYHNPEYIPPQPKEKTHECPHCTKAFRHKGNSFSSNLANKNSLKSFFCPLGNLMRHLVVHDPDAYKDASCKSYCELILCFVT